MSARVLLPGLVTDPRPGFHPSQPPGYSARREGEARPPRDGGKIETLPKRWGEMGDVEQRWREAESKEADPRPTGGSS